MAVNKYLSWTETMESKKKKDSVGKEGYVRNKRGPMRVKSFGHILGCLQGILHPLAVYLKMDMI